MTICMCVYVGVCMGTDSLCTNGSRRHLTAVTVNINNFALFGFQNILQPLLK